MANDYWVFLKEQNWLAELERKFRTAINVEHRDVINFSRRLAALYPGDYNILQICSIYEYLFAQWKYVADPRGIDYVAPASDSIMIMAGDCDDFAALMATLIEAIGGRSRIIVVQGEKEWHAYTEVWVGPESHANMIIDEIFRRYQEWYIKNGIAVSQQVFRHIMDDGNIWLNLDWTAIHPGGPFFEGIVKRVIYPR